MKLVVRLYDLKPAECLLVRNDGKEFSCQPSFVCRDAKGIDRGDLCHGCNVVAGSMLGRRAQMSDLARLLWAARRSGGVVQLDGFTHPRSSREAYAIQHAIAALCGEPPRGFKEIGRAHV